MSSILIRRNRDLYIKAKASFVGLLDLYPNAAAAYSLRLLRSAYTGACIRVRRSSDNAETDIGFDNNVLDTAALLAFVGSGNGFVSVWYDQSGAGLNVTQTSAGRQPRIVNGGVVELENSNPTLFFNGSTNFLQNANVNTGNPKSIFIVNKYISGLDRPLIDSVTTNQAVISSPNGAIGVGFGVFINSSVPFNFFQSLLTIIHNGVNSFAYRNTTTTIINNQNLGTNSFNGLRISSFRDSFTGRWNGTIQEIIIYPTNQTTNRTAIETNINNYYAIY